MSLAVHQKTPSILLKPQLLQAKLGQMGVYLSERYLYDQLVYWLNFYASQHLPYLEAYFAETLGLNELCQHFIKFCFRHEITIDKTKTLESFSLHNTLLDQTLKKELCLFKYKPTVNLFGFGLGDGCYEKSIASYLIKQQLADRVKIYGFEPYANKADEDEIEWLNPAVFQLDQSILSFDLMIARWVLHHVALQERWDHLIHYMNHVSPGGLVFIAEHGVFNKHLAHFEMQDKKLYYLLNSVFDIVANIGIRPEWFTDTAPDIGANFFIHYLEPEDFLDIEQKRCLVRPLEIKSTQKIYDIGPVFPNQTIWTIKNHS